MPSTGIRGSDGTCPSVVEGIATRHQSVLGLRFRLILLLRPGALVNCVAVHLVRCAVRLDVHYMVCIFRAICSWVNHNIGSKLMKLVHNSFSHFSGCPLRSVDTLIIWGSRFGGLILRKTNKELLYLCSLSILIIDSKCIARRLPFLAIASGGLSLLFRTAWIVSEELRLHIFRSS